MGAEGRDATAALVGRGGRGRGPCGRAIPQADGSWLTGEAREPLAGAVIETPAGASALPDYGVGILAEMTPTTTGTYELTGVRLRFRVNGGGEQVREGISVLWTICAGDPVPSCEPPEPAT